VVLESSLRRKETPVARFEATPLSLRATPYRLVGRNTPSIAPAGRLEVMCMLGISSWEPSRNSLRGKPLRIAGFQ